MNPFEVFSFSKGITDDTFEQVYDAAAELDNFTITSDGLLDSRDGSVVDNVDFGQIPAGVARVGALINYANNDKLFVNSGRQLFYRNPDAYDILRGPDNNEVLSSGDDSSAVSFSQWNNHLYITNDAYSRPVKVYKDENGVYKVRANGFDYLATDPVVTAGAVGTRAYAYAFHFHFTYMVGNQEFQDFGPTTVVQVLDSGDPSVNPNLVSGIPVLSNGVDGNYDLANVKIFIYRTVDGGETFYKVGEVTNGTTTFNDNVSDDFAQENGLVLYTDDGTVDFEIPPLAKFVHVVNNIGYYASTKEGTEDFEFRVRQSVPGAPGAVPGDFYVDLEDKITGLSSTKSIPLVFCKRYIYRLEQGFDRFGRGSIRPIRISDTAGCVSNLSIVQAENFVLWAGQDGFYASDGYQVFKISDSNNTRYRSILDSQIQQNRITGTFNEKDRRVYWGVQRNSSNLDNDSLVVLDMRWGVSAKSTFTTWSGNSFRPTALGFFAGFLYRGDRRGFVFKHSSAYDTDPRIDILTTPNNWSNETIIWTYKSVNINFGSTFNRKLPTKILLQAANRANTTIQIVAISDDGRIERSLKPIRWRRNFIWGDTEFSWNNPDCVWRGTGLIEQWRRFPARSLRLSYLQLVITNGYSIVTNSDTDGTATFDGTLNQITLDDTVNNKWPDDVVGYTIRSSFDGYTREFEVSVRNSDTVITVIDSEGLLPDGSLEWELWGFKKGEPLKLLGYNVHWSDVSQTQNTYETGQDGSNA
jgi:hypothetical protein